MQRQAFAASPPSTEADAPVLKARQAPAKPQHLSGRLHRMGRAASLDSDLPLRMHGFGSRAPAAADADLEAAEGACCRRVDALETGGQDELRCVPEKLEHLRMPCGRSDRASCVVNLAR